MKKIFNMIKKHWREYSIFIFSSVTFLGLSIFEIYTKEMIPMWVFSLMMSVMTFLIFLSFVCTKEIMDELSVSYKKFSSDLYKIHTNFVENLEKQFNANKISSEIRTPTIKTTEKDNG